MTFGGNDMKDRRLKLYNLVFPVWFLWIVPLTWLVVLPANFLIDFAVLFLTLKIMKIEAPFVHSKKVILKTWIFGFIADFAGAAFMLLGVMLFQNYSNDFEKWWNHNICNPLTFNPFNNIFSFLWTFVAATISALLIYVFNRKICLKKSELDDSVKKKLSIVMAIATAPYLFFLPTGLFM